MQRVRNKEVFFLLFVRFSTRGNGFSFLFATTENDCYLCAMHLKPQNIFFFPFHPFTSFSLSNGNETHRWKQQMFNLVFFFALLLFANECNCCRKPTITFATWCEKVMMSNGITFKWIKHFSLHLFHILEFLLENVSESN